MPPRSPSINKLCVERLSKTKGKPTLLSFLIVQNAESGLGGDPYHWPGQAMGLSFSVPEGVKVPSSLVNIFKELHQDLGCSIPTHGNLQKWALQGVLLLNAVLTVRKHHANSHAKKGWEQFTDGIIKDNLTEDGRVVFLLWGNNAREKSRNHRVFRDQMWSEEFLARLKKLEEAWKAAKNVGDKFPANTVYNKSKEPMKWIPAGEY
ncbi:hypothetical protein JHK85_021604 [Glycine max]|nr:hypothetical protein JHK85_021604 [Glycine max]KAG5025244.1 hypothetical protein JHK86_021158 [Glycine max]